LKERIVRCSSGHKGTKWKWEIGDCGVLMWRWEGEGFDSSAGSQIIGKSVLSMFSEGQEGFDSAVCSKFICISQYLPEIQALNSRLYNLNILTARY